MAMKLLSVMAAAVGLSGAEQFDGVIRCDPAEPGRCAGYMIPPACPVTTPCKASSSHCASLVVLPDGSLAGVCSAARAAGRR